MTIGHVSDTAHWVAVYRAMETERPDAHFRDPFARKLAGDLGENIVGTLKHGRRMAWAMIVRTQVFDEIILDLIRRERVDLVVNLAAGLDARPWRLDLPRDLRWVDVDLPAMLEHKLAVIGDAKPNCAYETMAADLTDAAARHTTFARLGAMGRRAIVVSEGLLIYLTEEQVGALATDLAAVPAFRWWVIDLAHPQLLKWMERSWGKDVQRGNAPFRFAPENGTAFFTPFGWHEQRFLSAMEEARRLKREMPGAWLWRFLGLLNSKKRREMFRRFSGFVVLERA